MKFLMYGEASYFVKSVSFVSTLYSWWKSRPRAFHLWYRMRYKRQTFSAIRYQKRKMPWIRGWFHDKILAKLLKTFNHKKSHTNLETNIISNERNFWKRWILSPKITALKHNENDFFRQHLPCEFKNTPF